MTALELITLLSQSIYVLIFILVAIRTVRQPTPAHVDMFAFFGILALVVTESRLAALAGVTQPEWFTDTLIAGIIALPYILVRLVDDFTRVPPWFKHASELILIAAAIVVYVLPGPTLPPPVVIGIVAYFAILSFYAGIRFVRAARRSHGVTQRRMEAVSLGAIMFGLNVVCAGAAGQIGGVSGAVLTAVGQVLGLGAGVGFYLGFAPPPFLRRAAQASDLRFFLVRAAQLPRLQSTLDIVRELERGAAASTGAQARIALWQDDERTLRTWAPDTNEPYDAEAGQHLSGRAFEHQRLVFSADPVRDDPQGAQRYRQAGVGAVMAAPITAGERRLGVLILYAERPPIFAQSDAELAQLLADQAAVVLESRALIDHAARVRAQEEATRLKEDFVSAAAHDLKTPLTTVVAQAQFLERKATRDPSAPADLPGLQRIVRESQRLATLVTDLLDAARLERGSLVGEREPVDLGALVADVAGRHHAGTHQVDVDVRGAVVGAYDRRRIEQLVENLVENAKKYSPNATPVDVAVWQENGEARISILDRGIGIPAADLPRVFERFARASNVDDRRFHGMGLGLYICRGIVEEHGGRIWVESEIGKGSTFHVALPLREGRRLN